MIQPVIKRDAVRVTAHDTPRAPLPARAGEPPHVKRARLLRVDGVVRALEVTCACGETTLVELEYPNATENPR